MAIAIQSTKQSHNLIATTNRRGIQMTSMIRDVLILLLTGSREADQLSGSTKKKKSDSSESDKNATAKKPSLFSESERPAARYSDLGGIESILEVCSSEKRMNSERR
jgi:hypothetical protein